MYQDYLNEREKYRKRQAARQQRLPQKQLRSTNTAAKRYVQQSRNFQRKTQKQFDGLLFTARAIAGTLKLVSNLMKTQVGMVMVGAVALISAFNHVKNLREFNREYAEEFGGLQDNMSTGKLSAKGKEFLIKEEGLRTEAYKDSKGKWTIGVGHTGQVDGKPVGPGMKITEAKARQLFDQDVQKFENYVNSVVKVPVTQNMFDAMVSYAFNVGSLGPKFLKKLNSKDYKGAMAELTTIDPELQARRQREQKLFGTSITADNKLNEEAINVTKYSNLDLKDYATKSDGGKGKADTTATSGKFGGYQTAKGVQIGRSAAKVLSQIEGSGTITSGLGDTHAKKSKHYTGHAVDVGMGGIGNDKVIETCINFLKHPAVAWVYVETFQKDLNWARGVEKAVRERVPQLCKGNRISSGTSEHVTGRHLHVEFDYNYMDKPQADYNMDKQNKPKPIPEKPKKKETKQEGKPTGGAANITIPEEETSSPRGLVNTGSVNIKASKQTPNKTKKS